MKIIAFLFVLFSCSSCRTGLYELPPPKPEKEWKTVSLVPGEDDKSSEALYQEARLMVLKIYGFLNDQSFEKASALMSIETQDFLTFGSEGSLAEVLNSKKMKLPNGNVVEFDPVPMLLAVDLTKLSDAVEGISENETSTRKEIFAKQSDGSFKRIVMIRQGDTWVLHRTRISDSITPHK